MDVLNVTELYTRMVKIINILYIFYCNKKLLKKKQKGFLSVLGKPRKEIKRIRYQMRKEQIERICTWVCTGMHCWRCGRSRERGETRGA